MTDPVWLNANVVRLQWAVLCADCEVISEGVNGRCECCGSQSLLGLSRVLGGTIEAKTRASFAVARSAQPIRADVRALSLAA